MAKLAYGSALFAELQSIDGVEPVIGPALVACLVRWRSRVMAKPRSAIGNDEHSEQRQKPKSADRLAYQPIYGFASFANEAT